jgi:NAD-dependent DNA ligase
MKQFDGAPIFRNLRICITGDFTHGTHEDIRSIFSSYSGKVVNDVKDANVVVVGGTQTHINGPILKYAQNKGITIFDEYSFFDKYEIDKDLQTNLQ